MQNAISSYLKTLITNLKDANEHPYFGVVVDYEPKEMKFDKTPYGYLVPQEQPAEYATTNQNDRREGFSLFICIPLEDQGLPRDQAFNNMRTLTDAVRNAVDQTEDLGGLSADAGKSKVMGVVPVTSGWTIVETSTGETLVSRLDIIAKYTYNFR
jgi:hypothetical protein